MEGYLTGFSVARFLWKYKPDGGNGTSPMAGNRVRYEGGSGTSHAGGEDQLYKDKLLP